MTQAALAIAPEGAQEIESRALSMPEQAKALAVKDAESFARAGEFLVGIKGLRKEIDATFDPVVKSAHEAHKAAVAAKRKVEDPLAEAERIVKRSMGDFQAAEDRERRRKEAELREHARNLAEDARLAEAAALEKAGEHRAAEAAIERPVIAPAVVLPPSAPKVEGVSIRKTYSFRITDEAALPREYLTPDTAKIGKVVRALGADCRIAGVEVVEERTVSARA